jgi:hypothetical protein
VQFEHKSKARYKVSVYPQVGSVNAATTAA